MSKQMKLETFGEDFKAAGSRQTRTRSLFSRVARARTEGFAVTEADGLWVVTNGDKSRYVVDLENQTCTCPDHEYRGVKCKHIWAAEFSRAKFWGDQTQMGLFTEKAYYGAWK